MCLVIEHVIREMARTFRTFREPIEIQWKISGARLLRMTNLPTAECNTVRLVCGSRGSEDGVFRFTMEKQNAMSQQVVRYST